MTSESSPLFLHRILLDQPHLIDLGRRRRLPSHVNDLGYLVHCQLGELFGELAPSPFFIQNAAGRRMVLLGYGEHDKAALRDHADTYADPAAHAAMDWDNLESKPMPTGWTAGRRLGFQVRICPVVRASARVPENADAPRVAPQAETDAFLSRCWREGKDVAVDREAVYRDWLKARLETGGGADLIHAEMTSFRIGRLIRRNHEAERKSKTLDRPVAEFQGELQVKDAHAFQELLLHGIGRHKAFGFGMILLRPPASHSC